VGKKKETEALTGKGRLGVRFPRKRPAKCKDLQGGVFMKKGTLGYHGRARVFYWGPPKRAMVVTGHEGPFGLNPSKTTRGKNVYS